MNVDVDVDVVGDGDGDVAVVADDSRSATQLARARAENLGMLSFQGLDVYKCAIELLALVMEMSQDIPRGHAAVIDQLKRAALSVPLNIAEGAGRTGRADAARTFAIARGSAMECAAIFDALKILKIVTDDHHRRGLALLEREVAMLTKLCR